MKLRIMTFNLRSEEPRDGINSFSNRKGRILDCIRSYSPDSDRFS